MIRLAKLTDYGLVVMALIARQDIGEPRDQAGASRAGGQKDAGSQALHTARDLATESRLSVPTVSKILKLLQQHGLLTSHRGVKGGYMLARAPQAISLAEIIVALEGSIALTECSTGVTGACNIEGCCSIRSNQRIINEVVRGALDRVMLSDLVQPMQLITITTQTGRHVPAIGYASGRTQ